MIYITGDTHSDFGRYKDFSKRIHPTQDDMVIILGDAGLNYSGDEKDKDKKTYVSQFPFTTFCIHGNHEMRPATIPSYETKEYRGGLVWYEPEFPNILFAKDGEVYDLDGRAAIVIGGAYSVDKHLRLAYGYRWFEDEQPSDEIKAEVESRLEGLDYKVDIVLSHTCPYKYMPKEGAMADLDLSRVDTGTEEWLDQIEERLDYQKWYCGHYHISKEIDKLQFMFDDFDMIKKLRPDKR